MSSWPITDELRAWWARWGLTIEDLEGPIIIPGINGYRRTRHATGLASIRSWPITSTAIPRRRRAGVPISGASCAIPRSSPWPKRRPRHAGHPPPG